MKVLHGAYINGGTFARPLPSQHRVFWNTMQAHRSDSKKDQWQTDKQGKEYLLGHRPHISSLPTLSHSSQPPWDVWVPFYKSGNWSSKEVKYLISNHRRGIITQAWTHILSYNMLVPKDGKMMVKNTTARMLPVYQTLTLPPLWWQHLCPTGVQRGISPSLPTWGAGCPSCLPLGGTALAFPRSWVCEACCSSSTLPCHHPPPTVPLPAWLLPPLLFSTSLSRHLSLLTIFRVLTRGSKMIHVINHPSTAWTSRLLAPVLTCVHPPLMHIMEKALALEPDGTGVPTQALSTRSQQQTSLVLGVVGKLQCDTMWYLTWHTAGPRDTASLLLHWLLTYFFTSKENLSFSSRLLPGPQMFQRKRYFTGTLNFTNGSSIQAA